MASSDIEEVLGIRVPLSRFFLAETIAEQVNEYVLREMTDPSGGFYSTEDADSEGEEGKFYVWTPAELRALLGDADARLFGGFYDVKDLGNFESRASILHMDYTPAEIAPRLGVTEAALLAALERGRPILFEARSKRVRPARDESNRQRAAPLKDAPRVHRGENPMFRRFAEVSQDTRVGGRIGNWSLDGCHMARLNRTSRRESRSCCT